jgi:hypothetical protein
MTLGEMESWMTTKAQVLKDIRSFCVHTCCAGSEEDVRECPGGSLNVGVGCTLWKYRFSSDPSPSKANVERGRKLSKKMLER